MLINVFPALIRFLSILTIVMHLPPWLWQYASMCIAIPPPLRQHPPPTTGWWKRLSASPARLLGVGATLQLLASALSSLYGSGPISLLSLLLALATLLLGSALQRIPERLHSLPLSYPLTVVLFTLLTLGGLLTALGSGNSAIAGLTLTAWAWFLALRTLRWKLHWAHGSVPLALKILYRLLLALGLLLGILLPCLLWAPVSTSNPVAGLGLVLVLLGELVLLRMGAKKYDAPVRSALS